MGKHLQRDLELLEIDILSMASIVESMIEKACRALQERQSDLAQEVFALEQDIDSREVHIEEESLKILALHQPVAIDLRRAVMVLKINNDLERMADLAVNIAERATSLVAYPDFKIPHSLFKMQAVCSSMVREALDVFVHLDADSARELCHKDDEIDALNREVIEQLYQTVREDSNSIEAALHSFSASRHIERIGDLATNIAEDVIYLVEGEITRHQHDAPST